MIVFTASGHLLNVKTGLGNVTLIKRVDVYNSRYDS